MDIQKRVFQGCLFFLKECEDTLMAAVGFGDWFSKSKQKLEDFTHRVKVFSK